MKIIRQELLLVLALLAIAACRSRQKTKVDTTTVIESDHFSSESERFTTYNISDAEANKPMITTLRPKKQGDAYDNPITVRLTSGSEQNTCRFTSYNDLCVLQKVKEVPPHMRVECAKLPCDIYFTNYQAPLIEPLESQKLDELYRLDSTSRHTILIFKCNDPDVKDYDKEVRIYSNRAFNCTYLSNLVFALFRSNTSDNGYVFVETSEKVQACTKMLSYKVSGKIGNTTRLKDFVDGGSSNSYTFEEKPKDTDLRLDISVIGFDHALPIKGTLTVELLGSNDGKQVSIQSFVLANPQNKTVLNVNTIFKKQAIEKYSALTLKLASSSDLLMINVEPQFTNVHQVDADELSYFSLEKGQTLSYRLVKDDQEKGTAQIELLNDNGKIDLSKKTCSGGETCNFELTAKEAVQQAGLRIKLSETVQQKYTPLSSSVSTRIREGDILYYTFKVKAKKEAELTVNSENVVVYVGDSKCPIPSQNCSNFTGNYKEPIFVESDTDLELFVAVQSLDDTRFTLRLIENTDDYIELVDGQPFTYSLKQADKIGFSFRVKEKTDTQFNLIAPLNMLDLYVSNSEKLPTGAEEDLKSNQGNILIKKEDMNGTFFSVLVQKATDSTEKIPFTLIASTTKAILPLEPSVSLYDNLQPDQARTYIISYKRKDTNVVSFYQFGTATVDLLIDVRLAANIKDLASEPKEDLKIRTTQELLELDTFAEDLCPKDPKEPCEMYLRLENKEKNEVDIVLTHLVQDSIIELKDGIWQSFPLSVTTSSTHFYFTPKHQNKSITVLYNTTYLRLRLSYKLWKNKDDHFDPSKWPFPQEDNSTTNEAYSPVRHISISPEPLKECWPDCLVLFTLLGIDRSNITNVTAWDDQRINDSFSIMASNDVIELMEHEKIDLILHEKEQKQLYIDLKYFLDKERLTFFTSSAVGSVVMYGSVSSTTKPRRPSPEEYDFTFGAVQTQIPVSHIKSKLEAQSMLGDREQYLRILILPYSTTKMSIEFTSKEDMIKQLRYDTSESIEIGKDVERMFQLVPAQDYRIRLIRLKGFPFIEWKVCDNADLEKCIDTMTNPVQLSSKTDMIEGKQALGKILVLKVQAKEQLQLDIYTQSLWGELELKEGATITDFCDKGETNRYTMTAHKEQQTVITVNVLEGNPTVKAWTNFQTPIVKTKKEGSIIHLAIPPKKERNETLPQLASLFMNRFDSFGLNSLLQTIHLQISDNDTNSYYTVSYTSGQRGLALEDGVITSTMITSGTNVTFFYENGNPKMELVATVSFLTVEELQHATIKLSYGNEEKNFEEQNPETPEIKKKTPHPTMVFKLPVGYTTYEIEVANTGKENSTASVTINQNEIVMLPYHVEYPVVLKPGEQQHLLVEVSNEGFLLLVVRKCDEGVPTLSYSFDFSATLRDQYQYEAPIKDEVRQEIFIKPKIGTLYIKFTVDVESVFSVQVQYYHSKGDMPKDSAKLGNQGIVDYQLINSIDAEISFVPLSCNGRPCSKVKYEYLGSTNLQNLYSQLVCPSNFFSFTEAMPPLHATAITVPSNENISEPVRFEYRLPQQISYFGIRATLENGREYIYKPIEIVTIWGHISRNKRYHNFVLMLFLGCVLFCICMLLRRRHRRGYGELKEEQDPTEHEATRLRPG